MLRALLKTAQPRAHRDFRVLTVGGRQGVVLNTAFLEAQGPNAGPAAKGLGQLLLRDTVAMTSGHSNNETEAGAGAPAGLVQLNDDKNKTEIRIEAARSEVPAVGEGLNGAAVCSGPPRVAEKMAVAEQVAHNKRQNRSKGGKLDPVVQAKLGETLRVAYQTLVEAPVPEKFLTLLERLATAEKRH